MHNNPSAKLQQSSLLPLPTTTMRSNKHTTVVVSCPQRGREHGCRRESAALLPAAAALQVQEITEADEREIECCHRYGTPRPRSRLPSLSLRELRRPAQLSQQQESADAVAGERSASAIGNATAEITAAIA